MKDPNDKISGQPIKRVRDFLWRLGNNVWSKDAIANFFNLAPAAADNFVDEMLVAKILEPDHDRLCTEVYYGCGEAGPRLRNARFSSPIRRARADSMLKDFLTRVSNVNRDKDLLYTVGEVRVFGSYIEPCDELGDLDIAIELRLKQKDGVDCGDQLIQRARQSGRRFQNLLERVAYAQREVVLILKARNTYLSIHSMEDLKRIGAGSRILFKENDQQATGATIGTERIS